MANSSSHFTLHITFIFFMVAVVPLAVASRQVASNAKVTDPSDKKTTECFDGHEGTVLIPGIGRYMIGSHELPSFTGLDHSIPAATNGQYIPGADDTFVPNPGFEVPNPAHGASP